MKKILEDVYNFEKTTAHLKKRSTFYPSIYRETIGDFVYLSTLVRIYRDDKWYVVHHVEKYHLSTLDVGRAYMKFMREIYLTQVLYEVMSDGISCEEDEYQWIDEKERLMNLM